MIVLLLTATSAASAQSTGAMTGLITDASGAFVPGVAVDVTSHRTAQIRSTTTAADGFFTIPLLAPGTYTVKAVVDGFRPAVRETVEVVVNETTRVDLVLELGTISDEVIVSASTPLVETRNATLGIVIDERRIVDLPLNGRNFTQLGTLMPGVIAPPPSLGGQAGNATPGGIPAATAGFNVNGMRNQSNNFLLDGSSNNDTFNTGFVLRPPPDAIQEFKILTHSYDAAYGRNAGSIVNVVTKSGTNQWQGSLWEFNRDDALQARNFFAASKPTLKQNQFGGALGGPIERNRLFGFVYVEGFRNTEGQTDVRAVLSAAQRSGDFSAQPEIRDPLTGLAFPGNIIPRDRISPVTAQWLERFVPLPNGPDGRVVRSPNIEDSRWQTGVRLDYRHRDSHTLLGRYIVGHTRAINPIGASNFPPIANRSVARLQDVMASDTWIVRPDTINVARVALNRIDAKPARSSGLNPRDFGFAYSSSQPQLSGLPFVMVQGFFTTGDTQSQFANRVNSVISIADDLTWVHGAHVFKVGGEVRRDHIHTSFIFDPNGDYSFTGLYSGNAAADFLLGFPAFFRQAVGDSELVGSSWTSSVFAQDEYRVGARVTLNIGVRYDVTPPFVESRDRLIAFHPGQRSAVFPTAPTGLVYPGDEGVPRGTHQTDWTDLATRLAAVWDPMGDGRTSVRGAWGLFYDTLPGQGDFFQNAVAPPFQSLIEVNFPLPIATAPFADPLKGIDAVSGFPPGLLFVGWGPEFRTPVAQHFNVSVQRQVGSRWGLEAGYVGSRARNLPIYIEVNPTTPILTPVPTIGPRRYPAFSMVRPTFSVGRSWYDSFQASARLRPWRGLSAMASYTLGHAVDHASGLNLLEPRPILPVTIGDESTFDAALAREKGDALFDVRHRVVVSFGYDIPARAAWPAAARLLLADWQINGIIQGQTGFPLTVLEPSNVSLTSLQNRPNMICDPNVGGARTTAQWFNTSCFERLTVAANAGQISTEPRNAVRGPGFRRVDLALIKPVRFHARHQVQLRIETFNLFNDVRFNQPGNQIGSPTFGQITSADDGRIVQLGIKYFF